MNDNDFNQSEFNDGPDNENQAGVPLGTGFEDNDGPAIVDDADGGKKIKSGTLILLAVVVLAGAGLYSMRSLGKAAGVIQSDGTLETTVNDFIDRLTGKASDDDSDEVLVITSDEENRAMSALTDDRTQRQVALDQVQKNPFVFPFATEKQPDDNPVVTDTGLDPEEQKRLAQQDARVDFEKAVAKLRLVMVMGGSTPMANLNGEVFYEGDVIDDDRIGVSFVVAEIMNDAVVLVREEPSIDFYHEIVVSLNQNF